MRSVSHWGREKAAFSVSRVAQCVFYIFTKEIRKAYICLKIGARYAD